MRHSDCWTFQFDGLFEVPRVRRDASALTLNTDSGHLWVVTDDKVRLVEFTSQGQFVREVELIGFEDTEGLCYVGDNRFLVAEEKKMRITLIDLPPDATRVKDDGRRIQLDAKSKKNKGLEGISYDRETDTLFAVREDKPPAVFRIQPLLTEGRSTTGRWSLDLDGLDDLSDTYFDPLTHWLWLLSHESQIAAAFDSQGVRVTELRLKKGHHNLPEDLEQAEGIVRDRQGTLFICSEPNRIYRFQPTDR
jgi:uncharacterized protein YjiK